MLVLPLFHSDAFTLSMMTSSTPLCLPRFSVLTLRWRGGRVLAVAKDDSLLLEDGGEADEEEDEMDLDMR